MTDDPIMDAVVSGPLRRAQTYSDTESYIEGEYQGEKMQIRSIFARHISASGYEEDYAKDKVISWVRFDDPEALITDIVGYYTGCLRPDGTARVSRRREG